MYFDLRASKVIRLVALRTISEELILQAPLCLVQSLLEVDEDTNQRKGLEENNIQIR